MANLPEIIRKIYDVYCCIIKFRLIIQYIWMIPDICFYKNALQLRFLKSDVVVDR